MDDNIRTIMLPMPMGMGTVNCYLMSIVNGYILIDCGCSSSRKELHKQLDNLCVKPGLLQLVLLTHGDFDHTGNAKFLHETYGARLAIHPSDAGMVEQGNMFVNRKDPGFFARSLIPLLTGFKKSCRFTPDLLLNDGFDLFQYGINARVVAIPGHSPGSIGILTEQGCLFCGDLFENREKPQLNSLMDDMVAGKNSAAKVKDLQVKMIYPGHGFPFPLEEL